ncbi:MAG: TonB-dependent receptor [Halioglobus sp.]|jgi:vitamin B12 transporter
MRKLIPPVLLAMACCAQAAFTADSRLEEMTVTASRVPVPLRQVGASVSVIGREEILARGFNNLADVLRYEPAISVSNTGGAGGATSMRIRGENGFRTKVLIDGIDITNTAAPQAGPHFEQLTSAGIERVEILRGPQGLMYGADAGGVVAITTPRGQPGMTGGVNGEFGRYGTRQFAGQLVAGSDAADFAVSATQLETDGFNATTGDTLLRDEDGYENTTLHGRVGWNFGETARAELVGHHVQGDNEYDACFTVDTFAPTDACSDDYEQRAWRVQVEQQGERVGHRLAYSQSAIDRSFFSEGVQSFAADSELQKAEYLGSWDAAQGLTLVYGVDLLREAIDDGSFDRDRDQQGYYLEYQGDFSGNLYLTAGVRHDDNDDFGSHTTYRVSGAWLFALDSGELKLKGSYGTGFRAPSLYEISYNRGAFAFPPAAGTALDAEESAGYDAGLGWYARSGWLLEAVYFDQRVEDEIFFDLVNFSGYLQGNGESRSRGVELITEVPLGVAFTLTGNYTFNETEDAEGGQRLRVPEHLANLGLRFTPHSGRLSLYLHLRLARDIADELGAAIEDYEVLDLGADYRLRDDFSLYGRVENVTDRDYQEVPSYNTPGAAAYAGLRYTF